VHGRLHQRRIEIRAHQDNKDLATHAGHIVKLTGELKGASIAVSKIEMP
jgi:hypothetical protein